ncbi:MAG TPA: hypothetical protein PL029_07715 [Bacteroidia bacterium]|nr:hypothetical protein [Bacteroidia bacterium]
MALSLSGIGLAILYMGFIAMFLILLLVTSLRLLIEKNTTQQPFRNLKTTQFFFANIFTGLFILLIAMTLTLLQIECLILDRAGFLSLSGLLLTVYFLPFICFVRLFNRARH